MLLGGYVMEIGIFISDEIEMYKDKLKNSLSGRYTLCFSPNSDILNYHLISGNLAFIVFDINAKGLDFATFFYKVKALYATIPVFLISDMQNTDLLKVIAERLIGYRVTRVFSFKNELQNFIHTISSLPEFDCENQKKIKKLYNTLIGSSKNTEELKLFVSMVAKNNLPVFFHAPTGCGKNVSARLIHELSDRKDGKFVCVDMGVVPEGLMESILFGAKKGAFTDAYTSTTGLIEIANHGTLFLDEIENTPLSLQIKLLGVLEDKKIRALGDNVEKRVDFRLICATNKNIKNMITEGKFRQDLYYRMNSLYFYIQPLKNRKEDIEPLAKYYCAKNNFSITDAALCKLKLNDWVGNVRELINVLDKAFVLSRPLNIINPENIRFDNEES